jgi:hypothetical protein
MGFDFEVINILGTISTSLFSVVITSVTFTPFRFVSLPKEHATIRRHPFA